jgi:hypothetical protein
MVVQKTFSAWYCTVDKKHLVHGSAKNLDKYCTTAYSTVVPNLYGKSSFLMFTHAATASNTISVRVCHTSDFQVVSCIAGLQLPALCVPSLMCDQLGMGATFNNFTVVQNKNHITMLHAAKSMCNEYRRST